MNEAKRVPGACVSKDVFKVSKDSLYKITENGNGECVYKFTKFSTIPKVIQLTENMCYVVSNFREAISKS